MTLTPKQEAFALAYIETGNASEAYRRAYDAAGMKAASVNRKAKELLDNGKITARLEAERAKLVKRHEVTVDRLIGEYALIAFADPGQFFEWGPDGVTVKAKEDLTPEQRRIVGELSQTVTPGGGTIKVKLHDKLGALQALGKHLGFFREDARETDPAAIIAAHEAGQFAVTREAILALCKPIDGRRELDIEQEVERRLADRLRGLPAPKGRQARPLARPLTVIEHEHEEPPPAPPPPAKPAAPQVRWPAPPPEQSPEMSARDYFAAAARRSGRRSSNNYDEFSDG